MSTGSMTRRPRSFTRFTFGALALASVGLVLVVLAAAGVFSGSSTVGSVQLHLAAATTPVGGTANAQQDPFAELQRSAAAWGGESRPHVHHEDHYQDLRG
jgi:hypothetical protein